MAARPDTQPVSTFAGRRSGAQLTSFKEKPNDPL